MVVATIFLHPLGVEIKQSKKHIINFVESEVYKTLRGQRNALLLQFLLVFFYRIKFIGNHIISYSKDNY